MKDTFTLEEMRTYRGRQEVPLNFDVFWDQQIEQLPVNTPFEMEEKPFQIPNVTCYELWFEGTNGGKVYAKCTFPQRENPVPVLFYFHGYQGQSPDWSQCLNYVASGYAVVCMDVRGQTGRSFDNATFNGITVKGQVIRGMEDGPEHLFFKDIYLDAYQLIEIISKLPNVDETKLYSYGASQGGALALVASALNARIQKVATIYPFLSDFKRVLELGDNCEPYNEFFRYFKFKDPLHETEEEILDTLSYIDIKNFAHRIQVPVLFVTGLEDEICPPSTQFAVYNRLNCLKRHYILPEYGHEALNVQVNDIVFNWLVGTEITI